MTQLQARSDEKAVRAFYAHLTVYLIVNATLLALNLLTGGPAWVVWPLTAWAFGLVAHGITVFLGKPRGPAGGPLADR
jgi:hypothetical protein